MIKQYYYKEKDLPVQNISTGNLKHQKIIEGFLTLVTTKVSLTATKFVSKLSYNEINARLEIKDDLDRLFTDR